MVIVVGPVDSVRDRSTLSSGDGAHDGDRGRRSCARRGRGTRARGRTPVAALRLGSRLARARGCLLRSLQRLFTPAIVADAGELAVADRRHLEEQRRLASPPVLVDRVGADHGRVRSDRDDLVGAKGGPRPLALLPLPLPEDRPGLRGPASARRPAPPQMSSRRPAPHGFGREERDERIDLTVVRGLARRAQNLDVRRGHRSRVCACGGDRGSSILWP